MMSIFMAGLALAAAAGVDSDMNHSVTIDYEGKSVQVTYRAIVDLEMRRLGAAAPNRISDARCAWVANVRVERLTMQVEGQEPHPAVRLLAEDKAMSGSRHGGCVSNRRAIEREIAAREDEVRAELIAIAEADRSATLAELQTANRLVLRD